MSAHTYPSQHSPKVIAVKIGYQSYSVCIPIYKVTVWELCSPMSVELQQWTTPLVWYVSVLAAVTAAK